MSTKVQNKKFTGSVTKLQKKAEQHILSEEQTRLKRILGDELYRDMVHFSNFNGSFEKSRIFKRMLDAYDEGNFDEYSSPIDFGIMVQLDPILVHSFRSIYGIFQSCVKPYYGGTRLFENQVGIVLPKLRRYQKDLKEKIGL